LLARKHNDRDDHSRYRAHTQCDEVLRWTGRAVEVRLLNYSSDTQNILVFQCQEMGAHQNEGTTAEIYLVNSEFSDNIENNEGKLL